MTENLTEEIYELSFEEISNPESPFYDKRWFESELLPADHEWFEIIGQFLLMCSMVKRNEYSGKNRKLAAQQKHHVDEFKELVPEIEDLIRCGIDNLEFAQKWADLRSAFEQSKVIKKEQITRASRGRFDRGTEQRRAWYASVYMIEKGKGKKGPVIKSDIAKFAERVRSGLIEAPDLWHKLEFNKLLHEKSTIKGPRLNQNLHRDMNVKEGIPYYAERKAAEYKLPPFEIKTSG